MGTLSLSEHSKRGLTWAIYLLETVPTTNMSENLFVALGSKLITGKGIIMRLGLQKKMY